MKTKTRIARRLLTVTAVTAVTMGMAAGAANAQLFGAFSPAGTNVQQGTLTLSYFGQTKQCDLSLTYNTSHVNGSGACVGGGTLALYNSWQMPSWNFGSPRVGVNNYQGGTTPWGSFTTLNFGAPVVNGNQSTPTKYVLSNTSLGTVYSPVYGSGQVYATGEVTVKTTSGGLVTVVPAS